MTTQPLPALDEMKTWETQQVREQYEAELAMHRANLETPSYRRAYNAPLSAHYRLGYLRWILDGCPQPQPRFV